MLALSTHATARHNWRRRRSQMCRTILAPPPTLTLSEWADRYRMLSRENSASPGRFRTDVVPYLREVMDACTDRRIREVVVMKGVQVAFTDGVVNNLVGFHMHQDPAPILVVQISVEEAEKWSKEKLAPMLRDTPVLRGRVKESRTRDSDNTILAKAYPGGHLGIVGANAPAGLRARPRRVVIFDEIDGFPLSAGKEGNPIKLGEKRATTFWNRKIVKGSTPTLKLFSNIEREFERSDQRRWFVTCVHCDAEQTLVWKGVQWDKEGDEDNPRHKTETAHYVCQKNGCAITESERQRMIRGGRWIATAPATHGETKPAGFHIPSLVSPFVSMQELAEEFIEAKNDAGLLQVFVNTRLAETFEVKGERVESGTLHARREQYAAEVPAGVGLLTIAVDVQGDRLEVKVKGWGDREESWLIHYERLLGDPGDADGADNVWSRLEAVLDREWEHEHGVLLRAASMVIDYGGHYADMVARFVKAQRTTSGRHVFAIRGAKERGKPLWPLKPANVGKHKVKVYEIGTDTAKDLILGSRVRRAVPGPGYLHFPLLPWCNEEYFAQLTAEQKIPRRENGSWTRLWVPTRERNEALDLEVYALAGLRALGDTTVKGLARRAEQLKEEGEKLRENKPVPKPTDSGSLYTQQKPKPRRGGWVNNW